MNTSRSSAGHVHLLDLAQSTHEAMPFAVPVTPRGSRLETEQSLQQPLNISNEFEEGPQPLLPSPPGPSVTVAACQSSMPCASNPQNGK